MISSSRRRAANFKTTLVLVSAGLLITAIYFMLDALDLGGIGEPTDIGGGLILVAGYLLIGVGVVSGGISWLKHRKPF